MGLPNQIPKDSHPPPEALAANEPSKLFPLCLRGVKSPSNWFVPLSSIYNANYFNKTRISCNFMSTLQFRVYFLQRFPFQGVGSHLRYFVLLLFSPRISLFHKLHLIFYFYFIIYFFIFFQGLPSDDVLPPSRISK